VQQLGQAARRDQPAGAAGPASSAAACGGGSTGASGLLPDRLQSSLPSVMLLQSVQQLQQLSEQLQQQQVR